ncbi:hypothetical protein [Neobacillus mesonae]|uniref:hypothetical protein n=1 Tax=Neobacillus mesonae TaxID=1193713 RepID=UPI00203DEF8B|nr:hypothetical protein [Neobacillus mesonae]MCM3568147.1 hypothetical protein [Neobacillus mesonae]
MFIKFERNIHKSSNGEVKESSRLDISFSGKSDKRLSFISLLPAVLSFLGDINAFHWF